MQRQIIICLYERHPDLVMKPPEVYARRAGSCAGSAADAGIPGSDYRGNFAGEGCIGQIEVNLPSPQDLESKIFSVSHSLYLFFKYSQASSAAERPEATDSGMLIGPLHAPAVNMPAIPAAVLPVRALSGR